MKKFFRNQKGFTLVELMITIVIVGILAAVAVPIYTANIKKAKMSECDAALGTIRTALRVYYATNDPSPQYPSWDGAVTADSSGLEIDAADLTGKYFAAANYTMVSTDSTYIVSCTNTDILSSPRTLNELGVFGGGL